jgi:magnesium chelatase subunit D
MMVLITDGRANVSLAKSNEDPEAMAPDAPKPSQDDLKVGCASFLQSGKPPH